MKDPYKVLGVSQSATDEEIKDAYRQLAKKYHPDQYADSPLAELADEKMKEINEAYDEIVSMRKQGKTANNNYGGYGYGNYNYGGYNNQNYGGYRNSSYNDVRSFINSGRIADADQILNGVPADTRDAEWYFLKGSVLYRRGWLEEAKEHFFRATQMDPENMEYRNAYNQSMSQRSGYHGGYNHSSINTGSCNSCDLCQSLICADCCCECMGGDLISCC